MSRVSYRQVTSQSRESSWTVAWTCLSVSLASLFLGFNVQGAEQRFLYSLYFLGEYAFGLLFIAGCRNHLRGETIVPRNVVWLLSFVSLACALPFLSTDFNDLFMIHAGAMASLFAIAFSELFRARRRGNATPGLLVMSVALALLTIDFLHYVPVFAAHQGGWDLQLPVTYFRYTSIFDLILEILLGFATMMVLMEAVQREVQDANRELTAARDRLEQIARIDPLTRALNRHAFHSLLSKERTDASGCVAVIDIDNLKPINDNYGHATGDAVIRAVARAIRTVTRAEDLLFRWGGDEFLVLMFGMTEPRAVQRLDSLNSVLRRTRVHDMRSRFEISVSWGVASFGTLSALHQAIDKADEEMYRDKQATKSVRSTWRDRASAGM